MSAKSPKSPPEKPAKRRIIIPGVRKGGRPPTGPTRNKGGRPTLLTYAMGARILKNVRLTAPLEDCAGAEGITAQTIGNWIARGEVDASDGKETVFAWFFAELIRARAGGRLDLYGGAVRIAKKNRDARLMVRFAERAAPDLYVPPPRPRPMSDPDAPPSVVSGGAGVPAVPRIFLPEELLEEDDEPAGEEPAGEEPTT